MSSVVKSLFEFYDVCQNIALKQIICVHLCSLVTAACHGEASAETGSLGEAGSAVKYLSLVLIFQFLSL